MKYLLPPKTTLTLITLGALLSVPEMLPSLTGFKLMNWREVPRVLDFVPRTNRSDPVQDEVNRLRPGKQEVSSRLRLFDPDNSLDPFYEALRKVEVKEDGATVRILHYGDSPTAADLITADVRELMQQTFGDAGHGFYLIARPWAWYDHRGVDSDSDGWLIDAATQSHELDGVYGLGGVSFRGSEGASTRFALSGGDHRLVEIAFFREPGAGTFFLTADDQLLGTVDTAGEKPEAAFATFHLPPGARRLEIKVASGSVRLFGIYLEKRGPGIVYSSLGLNGAYVLVLSKMFREQHWVEQLRHYRPDLIIINYGTNESVYPEFVDKSLVKETTEVVRRIRAAVPRASILLMSPMDRGHRTGGEIATVPVMARLVGTQERLAAKLSCAFFNTFQAMGGAGTMARWYQAEPRLVSGDFIHPMPAGARIVGGLLNQAILEGYYRYKLRRVHRTLADTASREASE